MALRNAIRQVRLADSRALGEYAREHGKADKMLIASANLAERANKRIDSVEHNMDALRATVTAHDNALRNAHDDLKPLQV